MNRTTRPCVAVTRHLPEPMIAPLRAHADVRMPEAGRPCDVAGLLAEAEHALVTPMEPIDSRVVRASPLLRQVITVSAGYDHIDLAACTARGVRVANTPGAVVAATADLAFGLMLAASRRIVEADRYVRAELWDGDLAPFLGQDVHHSRLGIIGMGRIGAELAKRGNGFDMDVAYHSRRRIGAEREAALGVTYRELDELLITSDVVMLSVNYTPDTHHLIGTRELALMKRSTVLVNTARGGVVDEVALVKALQRNMIAAAGLDVFEEEPALHPLLRSLDNVVLTPHLGSHTAATHRRMAAAAFANLLGTLRGAPLSECVNPGE